MRVSEQTAKALARRGYTVPVNAAGQAARQLQRRFGINPPTEQVDAAELATLRDKAGKHDALEELITPEADYWSGFNEYDMPIDGTTDTTQEN